MTHTPGHDAQAHRSGEALPAEQAQAPHSPFDADEAETPRNTTRRDLPQESPGRMVLPSRQSVYVTLHDISRGGCCVMRKGELSLQPNDKVSIEIWREDIQTKSSLPATVRWVRYQEGKTRAGLRFVDSSIKTHRTIDQYLQRSFRPDA